MSAGRIYLDEGLTGTTRPGCDNDNVPPTPGQQAQATRIAAELAALGFALDH